MADDFESWLSGELERGLVEETTPGGGVSVARLRAREAGRRRGRTLKAAALAVAAVLVTGGVALAAGTVVTGTPNPTAWGQQVSSQAEKCKQQLKPGQEGIGSCVSAFARQHGQQEKAEHSHGKSGAAAHGNGHGQVEGSPEPQESPEAAESAEPAEAPEPAETPEPPESPEPSESP